MLGNSLTGMIIVNLWGAFFFTNSSDYLHNQRCRSPFVLPYALCQPWCCFFGVACIEVSLHSLVHFFISLGNPSVAFVRLRIRNNINNFQLHKWKLSCKIYFPSIFLYAFSRVSNTKDLECENIYTLLSSQITSVTVAC